MGRVTTLDGVAPDLGGWLVAGEPKRTRLVFMRFREEMIGRTVVEELKAGIKDRSIEVEDWALIHKSPSGRVSITTDRTIDPGPVEGAMFGGAAGLVLAIIAGMVGGVPVLGGAAIGGLVAALMDSGLDNAHVDAVARLMDAGGTGLMIAVFEAAISRYQADIVPGRTFEQALEAYREQEEHAPPA
ncbi:MAG: hypothetical protein A2V85_08375 [Chloroflexi bacterium RBG_16_72_14]|nr:MAG: hypothetical protein A2V85_08375 [Chloroflexi bacterium RBG_16_72_14]